MSNNCKEAESPLGVLKSESARQRWELFHRAIAHAKQSNDDALNAGEAASAESDVGGPSLSVVR